MNSIANYLNQNKNNFELLFDTAHGYYIDFYKMKSDFELSKLFYEDKVFRVANLIYYLNNTNCLTKDNCKESYQKIKHEFMEIIKLIMESGYHAPENKFDKIIKNIKNILITIETQLKESAIIKT
jgi:hypothetical protein